MVRTTLRKELAAGLSTATGKYWLKQRRAMQPGFHKKKLEQVANIMIEETSIYMNNVLDKYEESQQEINLFKEALTLTARITIKSLFGRRFEQNKVDFFVEATESGLDFLLTKTRKPFLIPWYRINGRHAKNQRLKNARNKHIAEFIQKRQESGERGDDLLDMLLHARYEDGSGMTDQQLLDEAIILFIAGHETTGHGIGWTLLLLDRHPEIVQKILDYIDEHIGDRMPTLADVYHTNYIMQVIEESLRLYPPVWYMEREAMGDDNVDGVSIKKGQTVAFSIYSLHRNPDYWENPDKFDPDRFTAEKKKQREAGTYMPFGIGPRLCIGKNIALMEMQLVLIMILRRYKIKFLTEDVGFKAALTLCPNKEVMVKLEKR